MAASKDGFKIFGSPWTAAPWMKDNNNWVGGKLFQNITILGHCFSQNM